MSNGRIVGTNHPSKIVGWRVWYSNTVQSSREFTWEDLGLLFPDDVQIVMLYHFDETRRIMSGASYYWRWQSAFGLVYAHSDEPPDSLRYPGAVVLRGKWTSDENMKRIETEAMESKGAP